MSIVLSGTTPDMILHNGTFRTMQESNPEVTVVAVRNGKILNMGDKSVLNQRGRETVMVDLKGGTALPGFIDSHQHMIDTGFALQGLDFSGPQAIEEMLAVIREEARKAPPGGWIRGYGLYEADIREARLPTALELDRVAPDHLVFLGHASFHACSVNSHLFDLLELPPDLEGVGLTGGQFNGTLEDPATLYVFKRLSELIPGDERLGAMQTAADLALKAGITTLHCLEGGDMGNRDAIFMHRHQKELPLHTLLYDQTLDLDEVRRLGLPRIGGCILADGAIENHSAALFEPYRDQPDHRGVLIYSDEKMDRFVSSANRENLQVAIHAIGDRAIEQVIRAYEGALERHPRIDHRHRIEHLELPRKGQLERIAAAGIAVTVQPMFLPLSGGADLGYFRTLLGDERIRGFHPYRALLDMGILVAGGSDSPVTAYAPLESIYWAVRHPLEEHRISTLEGLQLFTRNAARIAFEESDKGSLAPGKNADLVVLSEDPLTVAAEHLAGIEVLATIVAGRMAYSR